MANGKSCPFCAGKRLRNDDECNSCSEKSVAFSVAKRQSLNVSQRPRDICGNNSSQQEFGCPDCQHTFEVGLMQGRGCPFCAGKQLCANKQCTMCHKHSTCCLSSSCCAVQNFTFAAIGGAAMAWVLEQRR
eukprot:1754619-Rhodomonas_salina.4